MEEPEIDSGTKITMNIAVDPMPSRNAIISLQIVPNCIGIQPVTIHTMMLQARPVFSKVSITMPNATLAQVKQQTVLRPGTKHNSIERIETFFVAKVLTMTL